MKPKILIIDDNLEFLATTSELVQEIKSGSKVLSARSGQEGIEIAKSKQPDVILLDIEMPKMDGFKVCQLLKADETTKHIPIILLTGIKNDSASRIKGLNYGADVFLSKPFKSDELAAQIDVVLRIKSAEDGLRNERNLLEELVQQRTKALRESEERYRSFVKNFHGIAYRAHLDYNPIFFNGAVKKITGYKDKDFVSGKARWDQIIHPDDKSDFEKSSQKLRTVPDSSIEREYRIIHKDGGTRWIFETTDNISDESGTPVFIQGAIYDITERKRTDKIKSVLFHISESTNSCTFEELLKVVHYQLGMLMDTTNFYIALYDKKKKTYSFPYCVDEYEQETIFKPQELKKSLTDYVRRTGKPLLVDEKLFQKLVEQEEVELVGTPSPIWMGAPLKTSHGVIGVVVVQNYKDSKAYNMQDMRLLSFVSQHIATAIERKQVEAQIKISLNEKKVLLKEIHHRVKNNLQIISSLLYLQSKNIKEEETLKMIRDSQSRVKSMALIHEKLYRSDDFTNINFSEYIRSLVTHLSQTYKTGQATINFKINVVKVSLTIETAIPCGLIINELVSNSLKYAFPNGRAGEVCIDFVTVDNNDTEKQYTLQVKDNGIGFPKGLDFKNTKSLGLQLVNNLTKQLGGELELEHNGGTSFKICFASK